MKKSRGAFRKFLKVPLCVPATHSLCLKSRTGSLLSGCDGKRHDGTTGASGAPKLFSRRGGGDRRSFRVSFEKTWRFDIFGAMECNRDDEKASLEKAARTAGFCVAALRSVPFRRPVRRGTFQPGPRGLFSAAKGGACGARGTLGSRGFYGRKSRRC